MTEYNWKEIAGSVSIPIKMVKPPLRRGITFRLGKKYRRRWSHRRLYGILALAIWRCQRNTKKMLEEPLFVKEDQNA